MVHIQWASASHRHDPTSTPRSTNCSWRHVAAVLSIQGATQQESLHAYFLTSNLWRFPRTAKYSIYWLSTLLLPQCGMTEDYSVQTFQDTLEKDFKDIYWERGAREHFLSASSATNVCTPTVWSTLKVHGELQTACLSMASGRQDGRKPDLTKSFLVSWGLHCKPNHLQGMFQFHESAFSNGKNILSKYMWPA